MPVLARSTLAIVTGYHGCERDLAERILAGEESLRQSENENNWLGPGIYFWLDDPNRGREWAVQRQKKGKINVPYVIGAYIILGTCLWTTSLAGKEEMRLTYFHLKKIFETTHRSLPKNKKHERKLDCAVLAALHQFREDKVMPAYDSVCGVFEDGTPIYKGSRFKDKTHISIAVRNTSCIHAFFRVRGA